MRPATMNDQAREAATIEVQPAELTGQIKEAATIQSLLCMHGMCSSCMNHIHLSACWVSFGQLLR